MVAEFDSSKYYLGALCKHQHDWSNTGLSLRRKSNGTCYVCGKNYNHLYTRRLIEAKLPARISLNNLLKTTVFGGSCVEWQGTVDKMRCGRIWVGKKRMRVHQIALEFKLGRPIKSGFFALHHCDNPPCFNPNHLYEGTRLQNAQDAKNRDRLNPPRGEKHLSSKLTNEQVKQIREMYSCGQKITHIANQMKVSRRAIFSIVNRKTWTHI